MISAQVVCDSECNGYRITTVKVVFPRFILAEVNTHASICRNTSSSRAIPVAKQIERVRSNPFIPNYVGKNKKGMQADEEVDPSTKRLFQERWVKLANQVADVMEMWSKHSIHKQTISRCLEPWVWTEAVWTATEWDNFFALRDNEAAQPEFRELAHKVKLAIEASVPSKLKPGEWHLPFVSDEERMQYDLPDLLKMSTARCARVSYLIVDGGRSNPVDDIPMCERLTSMGHFSPLEHPACAIGYFQRVARFVGFRSYRHTFANECHGDYTAEKYQKRGAVILREEI